MVMLMYRSVCSDEVTCKHLQEHTHKHAVSSAQTCMEACEVCVERLGSNPKFAVKTLPCVYSTSVIRAVACCPCQRMHSSVQQNNTGW